MGAFNEQLSYSWLTKYRKADTKLNYIRDGSEIDIYLETNSDKWFLYFGKIPSQRKSSTGQSIHSSIIAEGQLADDNSKKLVYKLLHNAFSGFSVEKAIANNITPFFEKEFDADFINSLDGKRNDEQNSKLIDEKIISFINKLPEITTNSKLIELSNLEFNNYDKKNLNGDVLPIIYSILFSEFRKNYCFVCTSTKLDSEEKRNLISNDASKFSGVVLTTNEVGCENFPIILPITLKEHKYENSNSNWNSVFEEKSLDDTFFQKAIEWIKTTQPKLLIPICMFCITAILALNKKEYIDELKEKISEKLNKN